MHLDKLINRTKENSTLAILLWLAMVLANMACLSKVFYFFLVLLPSEFVSTPGGTAIFTCFATRIQWLVNGVFLDELELNNVEPLTELIGEGTGRLRFTNISADQNMSIIMCRALLMSGASTVENDATSTLLLQGYYSQWHNICCPKWHSSGRGCRAHPTVLVDSYSYQYRAQ